MNFWDVHGIAFIICITLFPRLTMLVTGICFAPFSGVLFWLRWVFTPRLTAAILASMFYWDTNPVLVVFAWLAALSGESSEKEAASKLRR